MNKLQATAWGHANRYYAASMEELVRARDSAREHQGSLWASALEQASPGIRSSVERTCKQWNSIVRDYLRAETGFRLAVAGNSQSVPVKVDDGLPPRFVDVMRDLEGLEWLVLNRPTITGVVAGTRFMERHADSLRAAWGDAAGPSDASEIRRVAETAENWLRKLNEIRAVERIVGIEEDVLGAYFFRVPEIRLYWVVIGITARDLGVSTDALTIVVLAHELAHAYTHLGHDIDSEQWDTGQFAQSDLDIVEGLAQFYTQVVCKRLEERMPAAREAYYALLEKQHGPYRAHLKWVEDDERGGEIVRVSMIECRSKGITTSSDFAGAIKRHRLGVRGRNQRVTTDE